MPHDPSGVHQETETVSAVSGQMMSTETRGRSRTPLLSWPRAVASLWDVSHLGWSIITTVKEGGFSLWYRNRFLL